MRKSKSPSSIKLEQKNHQASTPTIGKNNGIIDSSPDFGVEKRFKLEIPNTTPTTKTSPVMSMNGAEKPSIPMPTGFQHLLAGGPLFGQIPSTNSTTNNTPPMPFNPAMLAALGALSNPANVSQQPPPDAAALHAFFNAGANAATSQGMPPFGALRQDLLGPMPPYFMENPNGFHPYTMDGGRRKNATREVTAPLKHWLNEHRKNPYPTKADKTILAIFTKMSMTQVSTWFANARRRLKKENKMTWSPRNRQADDEDEASDGDAEEDENDEDLEQPSQTMAQKNGERPSSSVSVLSEENRRVPQHFPTQSMEQYQQFLQSMANHQAMFSSAVFKEEQTKAKQKSEETNNQQRRKIWSIAETLNQARPVDLSSALNTSSSTNSLSPPQNQNSNAATAALASAATKAANIPAEYAQQFAAALAQAQKMPSESNGQTPTQNVFPPGIGQFPFNYFAQMLATFDAQRPPQMPPMPAQFNGNIPPQFFAQLFAQQQQHQQQQQLAAAMMTQMLNASQNGLKTPTPTNGGVIPPQFLMSQMAMNAINAAVSTANSMNNNNGQQQTNGTRNASSTASSEASETSTRPPSTNGASNNTTKIEEKVDSSVAENNSFYVGSRKRSAISSDVADNDDESPTQSPRSGNPKKASLCITNAKAESIES